MARDKCFFSRGSRAYRHASPRSYNDPQVPLYVITQANALGITQSHFEFAIKQER